MSTGARATSRGTSTRSKKQGGRTGKSLSGELRKLSDFLAPGPAEAPVEGRGKGNGSSASNGASNNGTSTGEQTEQLTSTLPSRPKRTRRPTKALTVSSFGDGRGRVSKGYEFEPFRGMRIRKYFEQGEGGGGGWFDGEVISSLPEEVVKNASKDLHAALGEDDEDECASAEVVPVWTVRYTDGDEEELEREEVRRWSLAHTKKAKGASYEEVHIFQDAGGGGGKEMAAGAGQGAAAASSRVHVGGQTQFGVSVLGNQNFAGSYETALESLIHFPGINEREAKEALNQMKGKMEDGSKAEKGEEKSAAGDARGSDCEEPKEKRPRKEKTLTYGYGLQEAMRIVHRNREKQRRVDDGNVATSMDNGKAHFEPFVGMRVRKMFDGYAYFGTVTKDAELVLEEVEGGEQRTRGDPQEVLMWEVTFNDGDKDDMDWDELLRCRADRPLRLNPVRGRQLCALELFSGRGVVSQEFAERRWAVRSVDTDPNSNATDKVSITSLRGPVVFHPFGFVPDFIWASPPCFTYSNMAGGKHRSASGGLLEKTPEALEHNHYFARMARIMEEARRHNPHLIVVIENPVGLMSKMPLMEELVKQFGLHRATVHYCAFGRDDKKPTHLWTNDFGLAAVLGEYTCERRCPHERGGHPISIRRHGSKFNGAAIPQALAEEVAEYVTAKFYMDRIRYTRAPKVEDGDESGDDNDNDDRGSKPAAAVTPLCVRSKKVVAVTP